MGEKEHNGTGTGAFQISLTSCRDEGLRNSLQGKYEGLVWHPEPYRSAWSGGAHVQPQCWGGRDR